MRPDHARAPAAPRRLAPAERDRLIAGFFTAAEAAGEDDIAVLQALCEQAALLGGVSCSVFLVRPPGTHAELVAFHVDDPDRLRSVRDRVIGTQIRTDETALAEVLRTGEPVFLPTPDDLRILRYISPGLARHMADNPVLGQAWVPIRLHGSVVGAIGLSHGDPVWAPLDDEDLAVLEALGAGASLLLAHADARRGLREGSRRSDLITEFFGATEQAPDEAEVFRLLARFVCRAVDAATSVLRLGPDGESLVMAAISTDDPAVVEPWTRLLASGPLRAGEGLPGRVLVTGEPVFVPDVTAEIVAAAQATFAAGRDARYELVPRSVLAVPVTRGGHTVAVIQAARFPPSAAFTPFDLGFVTTLAVRASVVLETVAGREAVRREVERARIVASFFADAAGAADADEVHRLLVDHVLEAIHGGAVIYRVAEDGEHLDLAVAEPPNSLVARLARPVDVRRLHVGEAISGRVAATGEPFFRARFDPAEREAYLTALPPDIAAIVGDNPPPAAIAVPLRTLGDVTGVLFASREPSDPDPFDASDFAFVEALATRATTALDAVAVREAADRDAERERTRSAVFEASSRAADDASVLRGVAEALASLGGFAWIQEFALDGWTAIPRAFHAAGPELNAIATRLLPTEPFVVQPGSMFDRLAHGHSIFFERVTEAALELVSPDRRDIFRQHVTGLIAVPLRRRGVVLGSVLVAHADPSFRGYERHDLAFLESLSAAVIGMLERVMAQLERDAAAEELRTTSRTLQAILDASPVAIIAIDRDNEVRFWSKGAERLYGWSSDEVLGRLPPHFGGLEMDMILAEQWRRVDAGETSLHIESRRTTKTGNPVDVTVDLVPLRDEVGAIVGLLTVQEDVTERRRLETDLIQAQKMETVGRLAGGIAHDFNNILTAILGYAELGRSETSEPGVIESFDVIAGSAERAAGLTQQLLAFSRRQMLQPAIVDANDVVREVEPMLRRLIGEHIELVVTTDPAAGNVMVDRTQLGQVVLNLAVNARDAMREGGRLTIATERARFSAHEPHPGLAPGEYAVLSVSDTGIGMDEETRAHIFEPFFTTKGVGEGTGLGLATVYGIVRQSAGHIWVYSEPGQGTVFKIYLPRVGAESPAAAEAEEAVTGDAEVVLLVEDDPLIRAMGRRILDRRGFRVLEAAGPADALEVVDGSSIDILVTDVVMPGMTGVELARRLRERWPELPVLLMSGYADDAADAVATASAFLPKPFSPDTLARTVRTLLDGRRRNGGDGGTAP